VYVDEDELTLSDSLKVLSDDSTLTIPSSEKMAANATTRADESRNVILLLRALEQHFLGSS